MQKTFQPQDIERELYERWEQKGYFAGDPSRSAGTYCIMIPPPNVTGTLHMGHAFQDTIMDGLIRYHRMRGDDTLWQVGTDHAGIATQMVVERQLNAEGKDKRDLGREAFLERVWDWKGESGGKITRQLRTLGASVDWTRERFTMDAGLSEAVTEVFVKLHEEGLIYRGKRLVNWDPVLRTALSDLEVVSEEEDGHIWHLRYPLHEAQGHVVVATTRPETLLGDTAVAVHPDDERFSHLIGKHVALPLTDRLIQIVADEYVDAQFGSGCVKITPAHDFNDYEVGKRHQLAQINVLNPDASMSEEVPQKYRGLDRYEARKLIVADLDALGLLERTEAHRHAVPRGDRSGEVLEPLMTDQWYVKTKPLAQPAIEAVTSGRIRFVPENWSKTYFQWMNNIEDWCISRQLWWGHRIPAWYTEDGQVYVGHSEQAVRERYNLTDQVALTQDPDVLDTWFSSALWPFSTLGWPQRTPELARYYPTSVLVTGFDIIFFWVARMIMMGLKFMGEVPFRDVYIHGLVRDSDGQKMSKSKGNVLDPLDLINGASLEELLDKRTGGLMQPQMRESIAKATKRHYPKGLAAFGTDALRFTFMAMATTGRDIKFDLGRIEGYRNFCNKLWNATRYVLMNTEDADLSGEATLSAADSWIISRLHHTLAQVDENFANYRFDLASQALYEFTWHEFCDWYLELSKPVLQDAEELPPAIVLGARRTLAQVLEALLRALHPLMPFITEALWQRVAPLAGASGETVMLAPYPLSEQYPADADAETQMQWVMQFLVGVRQIRGEMDIAPSRKLRVLVQQPGKRDRRLLEAHQRLLMRLGRMQSIEIIDTDQAPVSAITLLGETRVLVPLEGLIDVADEIARLNKQLSKIDKDLKSTQGKLANDNFVNNAPAAVVEEQHRRCDEFTQMQSKLSQQLELLSGLTTE